jgi:predicted  nucleic acid-binding Zn-ribbon protein
VVRKKMGMDSKEEDPLKHHKHTEKSLSALSNKELKEEMEELRKKMQELDKKMGELGKEMKRRGVR